jgi:hypothetical protein
MDLEKKKTVFEWTGLIWLRIWIRWDTGARIFSRGAASEFPYKIAFKSFKTIFTDRA